MSALRSSFAFLGTCALAGVGPLAYVREVLIKLQGGWPAARIDELLPAHWATTRAARTEAPAPAPTAPAPA